MDFHRKMKRTFPNVEHFVFHTLCGQARERAEPRRERVGGRCYLGESRIANREWRGSLLLHAGHRQREDQVPLLRIALEIALAELVDELLRLACGDGESLQRLLG